MSDAWDDINPPIMSSGHQTNQTVLHRARLAKKYAEWAFTFAREGNLQRAEEYLEKVKYSIQK